MNLDYFSMKLEKKLFVGKKSFSGRNMLGRICVFSRGGGLKRKYLFIDFFRRLNLFGYVIKIVKDINRNSLVGLVLYDNGLFAYIIMVDGLSYSSLFFSGIPNLNNNSNLNGSALPLLFVKVFSVINNLELKPFFGSKLVRAAGSRCVLLSKSNNKAIIKLNSGWQLRLDLNCLAVLGVVSNHLYKFFSLGSAGKKRNLGFRPKVRGVAKNPCDHPHGGGNGKKSPPVNPVSPWSHFCKGRPSLNKKFHRRSRFLFKIY